MRRKNPSPSSASENRILWIDIARGLGILLVVYGHARVPHSRYVYLFHMPFFMLLSGYLYPAERSLREDVIRRIRTLYLPFLGWNLLLLSLILLSGAFRGLWETVYPSVLQRLPLILLAVEKEGRFLGATWFLASLFWISVLYRLLDTLLSRIAKREWVLLLIFGAIALAGSFITLPHYQSRTMVLSFFFAVGRCVRTWARLFDRLSGLLLWILTTAGFLLLAQGTQVSLANNTYSSRVLFLLCALLGSWSACNLARLLAKFPFLWIHAALRYLGAHSLEILLWHFIAFRFIVALQMPRDGYSVLHALFVNSRYDTSGGWWILYLAAGLVLPLVFGALLNRCITACRKRFRS